MRILIDTNRLSDFFHGDRHMGKLIEESPLVRIPFIAQAELEAGFLGGAQTIKNRAKLQTLLERQNVALLFPNHNTTMFWAELAVQLRRAGTPIPDNDLWIAALALQHDLALATRDKHFQVIGQLHFI
ncbi:MAG: PIN domain-containing protein [Bryobacteraceae bacterium]|nr:PIN domain-containing protein [Bryobacteraceae bacterium]